MMPYTLSGDNLVVFVNGKQYVFHRDSLTFDKVLDAVRNNDAKAVEKFADVGRAIRSWSGKTVEVKNGEVYYKGNQLHNALTNRIVELVKRNMPCDGMIVFLENLMQNPSKNSVEQLYKFLEHKSLPITEDGHFLAYKRIRSDWTDFHTGTFVHTVGSIHEMERNTVDDNPRNHCSYGFHAGAMDYVKDFNSGQGVVIVVKINPKDVVSVPEDHNCTKLRTCRYEVVDEYKGDLESPMYSASVQNVHPSDGGCDWDYDDEY